MIKYAIFKNTSSVKNFIYVSLKIKTNDRKTTQGESVFWLFCF